MGNTFVVGLYAPAVFIYDIAIYQEWPDIDYLQLSARWVSMLLWQPPEE